MTKKQRGGARPGAGRKRDLPYEDRVVIGSDIKSLMLMAAESAFTEKVRQDAAEPEELERLQQELRSLPLSERRAWNEHLATTGLDPEEDDSDISRVFTDVRSEIGEKRHFRNPGRRPYGVREQAIRVAMKKHSISKRMAVRCLNEYQRFTKRRLKDEREPI